MGGMKRRTMLQGMAALAAMAGLDGAAQSGGAVYQLRIYHTFEGRLPALLKRFREHAGVLFVRHGMTPVAYWVATDEPMKGRTLYYILKFPSREAAVQAWKAFGEDPEWLRVETESEVDGKIIDKVESTYLESTDFSPKV
jgi:NIPSNAP